MAAAFATWLGWSGGDDLSPPAPTVVAAAIGCPSKIAVTEVAVVTRVEAAPSRVGVTAAATGPTPLTRLQALVARLDAGDTGPERVRDLRDLLVAAPELIAAVPSMATDCRHGERTAMRLLQALELAATPACQRALATVAATATARCADRRRAILALGNVPLPTPATMQRLREACDDRADATAVLLSGAAKAAFARAANALRPIAATVPTGSPAAG